MHATFSPDEGLTFALIPILYGEGGRSGWSSVSYFYLKTHIQASGPEGLKGQAPLTELDLTLLLGPGSWHISYLRPPPWSSYMARIRQKLSKEFLERTGLPQLPPWESHLKMGVSQF